MRSPDPAPLYMNVNLVPGAAVIAVGARLKLPLFVLSYIVNFDEFDVLSDEPAVPELAFWLRLAKDEDELAPLADEQMTDDRLIFNAQRNAPESLLL